MFGEEYRIVRYFPEYFLDYREVLDASIRWTDRIQSSSGDWSGNLFDFFFRVYNKLTRDFEKPFALDGAARVDDTPVHKAVREALANCIVNTDFYLPRGIVILKEQDKVVLQNPGSIRTGKEQMLRGGISDPRNKAIMKMLNLIAIGERAGSGVPDICSVWADKGWKDPEIEEQFDPDRTILTLAFTKKQAERASGKNTSIKNTCKEVRMLLSNRSVFYRRFAEAYPEVIFKTERIAKRMEEIRVETERLRQEAEERVAQMRLEVAENLEPTRSVKNEIIEKQDALIGLLYREEDASPEIRELKREVESKKAVLQKRRALFPKL